MHHYSSFNICWWVKLQLDLITTWFPVTVGSHLHYYWRVLSHLTSPQESKLLICRDMKQKWFWFFQLIKIGFCTMTHQCPYKHLFAQKYSLTRLSIITFAWVVGTCFGSSSPQLRRTSKVGLDKIPKQSSQL